MKDLLKSFKLNENNISMLLGAAVIVIVGFLVVNYFRNLESTSTVPTGGNNTAQAEVKLPTKHIVETGDTLWSIAEKYYKSGYNWVDIQKANALTNASIITKGQELTIPAVEAKTATIETTATVSASPIAEITPTATSDSVVATSTPSATQTVVASTDKGGAPVTSTTTSEKIDGSTYTVVHGDNLWTIAVKAYGDGYKWTTIASANKLSHPGVIHAGNVLQIPR